MTSASLGTCGLALVATTVLGAAVANGFESGPRLRWVFVGVWVVFGLALLADVLNVGG